jgi:hypothetical protein
LAFLVFGRAVLSFQSCAVLERYARENRTQMIGRYHAAVGKKRGKLHKQPAKSKDPYDL